MRTDTHTRTAPIETVPRWWTAAACQHEPTTTFFGTGPRQTARAVAICQRCPVRRECYQDAVENGEMHGVWGGVVFHKVRP